MKDNILRLLPNPKNPKNKIPPPYMYNMECMPPKPKRHPNSLKSPQILESIVRNIKQGMFRDDSARMAGINPKTLYRWIGEDEKVREMIEAGEAYNRRFWVRLMAKHGRKHWQAMAWLLERRHREFSLTQIEANRPTQVLILGGGYKPLQAPTTANGTVGGVLASPKETIPRLNSKNGAVEPKQARGVRDKK